MSGTTQQNHAAKSPKPKEQITMGLADGVVLVDTCTVNKLFKRRHGSILRALQEIVTEQEMFPASRRQDLQVKNAPIQDKHGRKIDRKLICGDTFTLMARKFPSKKYEDAKAKIALAFFRAYKQVEKMAQEQAFGAGFETCEKASKHAGNG